MSDVLQLRIQEDRRSQSSLACYILETPSKFHLATVGRTAQRAAFTRRLYFVELFKSREQHCPFRGLIILNFLHLV
ncbi:hypothetical protein J6590_010201 [Homalodisca vitripennis]|nr:hypothetical protein J6590_010201 [Homalodisca vitripennis]